VIFHKKIYDQLCKECDKLLIGGDFYRMSNDWLHVNRQHPIFLKKYNILEANSFKFYFHIVFKLFFYLTKVLRSFFLSIISFNKYSLFIRNIESSKFIFFSHIINKESIFEKKDFYFKDLPNELINNKKSTFFYLNHTRNRVKPRFRKKIIPNYLPVNVEIQILLNCFLNVFSILKLSYDNKFQKRVILKSSIESISPSTLKNCRFYFIVRDIIKKSNCNKIFTTYEGHSWERIVYYSSKEHGKNINTYGYHNTVVFKNQHSLKRNLYNNFDPDFVICKGKGVVDFFTKNKFRSPKYIINIGSDLNCKKAVKIKTNDNFLILPEADIEECKKLFVFTLKLSQSIPNSLFIFRLHPMTSKKLFLKSISNLKFSENLKLSNQSIEDDFKQTGICIYRGSTAVLKAIRCGLRIIYANITYMNIDALSFLNIKTLSIKDINELRNIMNDKNGFQNYTLSIQKKINKYFSPKNNNVLINMIDL